MDATNETLQELRRQIRASCERAIGQNREISLSKLMSQAVEGLSAQGLTLSQSYHADYVDAMILMEAYETNTLQEADTELEEETR